MKKKELIPTIILALLCAVMIYPLLLVIGISFSNERDVVYEGYRMIPKNFDISAYKYIFENPRSVFNAYKVTIFFSVTSTILGVLLMTMMAFTLSRKGIKGKSGISFYLYFTMLFSGGLVPSYILITQYLGLANNIMVYVVTGLVSPWYIFMLRTFFQGIPYELSEAAVIDGASEYRIFFGLILPLSKPAIATVALFMFLAKWNDWYTSMLYINSEELYSLQYLLQRIMLNIQLIQNNFFAESLIEGSVPSETVRMAMAVVVAGPALLVFPFFQKYFVKGLTVGGVKG